MRHSVTIVDSASRISDRTIERCVAIFGANKILSKSFESKREEQNEVRSENYPSFSSSCGALPDAGVDWRLRGLNSSIRRTQKCLFQPLLLA